MSAEMAKTKFALGANKNGLIKNKTANTSTPKIKANACLFKSNQFFIVKIKDLNLKIKW